jgi:hypothetical protein
MRKINENSKIKVIEGAKKSAAISRERSLKKYYANPVICNGCCEIIDVPEGVKVSNVRKKKFCDCSCAAKFNNKNRHKKEKRKCLTCGKVANNKYCSSKCHKDHEWNLRVKRIEQGEELTSLNMKKYLIEKFGNTCQNKYCGWDWSKCCIIELEHIDGNSFNNSLENLMLLCPNCHSNTDTYKGKNKGRGRFSRRQRYKDGKSF